MCRLEGRAPEFVEYDANWFGRTFVQPGLLLANNTSLYCSMGDNVMLFSTKSAALAYGERDAAIARVHTGARELIG